MQFVDIWRLMHPTEREYTFFSPPHNTFSRIDYFFASPALISTISTPDIHDARISDHSPIAVHITQAKPSSPSPTWRFPSYLADSEDFRHTLYEAWEEYISTNGAHISDPNLFWEAGRKPFYGVKSSLIPLNLKNIPDNNIDRPAKLYAWLVSG